MLSSQTVYVFKPLHLGQPAGSRVERQNKESATVWVTPNPDLAQNGAHRWPPSGLSRRTIRAWQSQSFRTARRLIRFAIAGQGTA
jgi:hypothetical protein